MFESLQDGLSSALKSLSGQGKLTEANMREGLKLVERSLLEADVSFDVARHFMKNVTEKAVGEKVLKALKPQQMVVGIVYEELQALMGPVDHSMHLKGKGEVTVLMMCGLQGAGKTTTCGKLGKLLKDGQRKPLLVAADLQRPAAIDQLHVLGDQLGIPVYSDRQEKDPVKVCNAAVAQAKKLGADVVILDTAGRLHIDEELMGQLERIDKQVNPQQIYLVVDAMTGQDAVNSAKVFNDALEIDGVIMTKLDGDARGGAALSVKHVTGVPIKFMGTGEKLDALEPFHPDRMAQRILGQGDILTLFETAQKEFDQEQMLAQEEKLKRGEFTLDDFRKQMAMIAKPGLMQKMLGMMPGMGQMRDAMNQFDEGEMKGLFGIIDSMTAAEKSNTKLIDQSRRRRIAAGAGCEPHQVGELIKQYEAMAGVMTAMAGKGIRERMKMMGDLQSGLAQGGTLGKQKQNTGKRLSTSDKKNARKAREAALRKRKRKG
ncbi:signal recognition particle protein [Aeoliella sp. SH292]|uniref:signal recognition particle protein n=1 Tax=Aeoliella sp. SH292 TaxID=3454464 RepID=UPI003F99EF4F